MEQTTVPVSVGTAQGVSRRLDPEPNATHITSVLCYDSSAHRIVYCRRLVGDKTSGPKVVIRVVSELCTVGPSSEVKYYGSTRPYASTGADRLIHIARILEAPAARHLVLTETGFSALATRAKHLQSLETMVQINATVTLSARFQADPRPSRARDAHIQGTAWYVTLGTTSLWVDTRLLFGGFHPDEWTLFLTPVAAIEARNNRLLRVTAAAAAASPQTMRAAMVEELVARTNIALAETTAPEGGGGVSVETIAKRLKDILEERSSTSPAAAAAAASDSPVDTGAPVAHRKRLYFVDGIEDSPNLDAALRKAGVKFWATIQLRRLALSPPPESVVPLEIEISPEGTLSITLGEGYDVHDTVSRIIAAVRGIPILGHTDIASPKTTERPPSPVLALTDNEGADPDPARTAPSRVDLTKQPTVACTCNARLQAIRRWLSNWRARSDDKLGAMAIVETQLMRTNQPGRSCAGYCVARSVCRFHWKPLKPGRPPHCDECASTGTVCHKNGRTYALEYHASVNKYRTPRYSEPYAKRAKHTKSSPESGGDEGDEEAEEIEEDANVPKWPGPDPCARKEVLSDDTGILSDDGDGSRTACSHSDSGRDDGGGPATMPPTPAACGRSDAGAAAVGIPISRRLWSSEHGLTVIFDTTLVRDPEFTAALLNELVHLPQTALTPYAGVKTIKKDVLCTLSTNMGVVNESSLSNDARMYRFLDGQMYTDMVTTGKQIYVLVDLPSSLTELAVIHDTKSAFDVLITIGAPPSAASGGGIPTTAAAAPRLFNSTVPLTSLLMASGMARTTHSIPFAEPAIVARKIVALITHHT